MGYTHYWTNKKASPMQWEAFADTVKQLIIHSEAKIRNGFGEDEPEITDTLVALNGSGDLSHETFMIDNENIQWDFCKTARKPYDEVVVASLIYGKHIGIIEEWSSDGAGEDHDAGRELLDEVGKLVTDCLYPVKQSES